MSATKYITEWEPRIKKNGQPGKILDIRLIAYSPVNKCDLCGKIGPPKKVNLRSDVYGWNRKGDKKDIEYYQQESKNMLCMGCWNKIRKIEIQLDEIQKLKKIIIKIETTVRQHNRGIKK